MKPTNEEALRRIQYCCAEIMPILHGQGPDVQGSVLADLVALWLVGHHPDLRETMLDGFLQVMRELIPVNEHILFGDGGFPKGHA